MNGSREILYPAEEDRRFGARASDARDGHHLGEANERGASRSGHADLQGKSAQCPVPDQHPASADACAHKILDPGQPRVRATVGVNRGGCAELVNRGHNER
jgi:hypothetical protein